jgi:hypothetical protein
MIIQWILFFCLYALNKNLYSETVYKLPRFVAHDKQMLHSSLEYLQTNEQSIGLMMHRNNLMKQNLRLNGALAAEFPTTRHAELEALVAEHSLTEFAPLQSNKTPSRRA